MRRFVLATLFLGFSADSLAAQGAQSDSVPTFKTGARVRAQISAPSVDETEWFTGTAASSVDGCSLFVLDDVPSQFVRPEGTVLVTFQNTVALQLSSLYDGHIDPVTFRQRNYAPGKSLEGEEWLDVSVDSLKAADPAKCRQL